MTLVRLASTGVICLCAVLQFSGCSSLVASRTIEQFANGLQQGNLDSLKDASSDEFERRALRTGESVAALKVLPLPTGSQTILEIEDVSADERVVTVDPGDDAEPVKYRLRREKSDSPPCSVILGGR